MSLFAPVTWLQERAENPAAAAASAVRFRKERRFMFFIKKLDFWSGRNGSNCGELWQVLKMPTQFRAYQNLDHPRHLRI
jgi:hypothetical protein